MCQDDLTKRIATLERTNRRTQILMICAVVLMGVPWMMAAADSAPKLLRVAKLEVVNSSGKVVASLEPHRKSAQLQIFDEAAETVAGERPACITLKRTDGISEIVVTGSSKFASPNSTNGQIVLSVQDTLASFGVSCDKFSSSKNLNLSEYVEMKMMAGFLWDELHGDAVINRNKGAGNSDVQWWPAKPF